MTISPAEAGRAFALSAGFFAYSYFYFPRGDHRAGRMPISKSQKSFKWLFVPLMFTTYALSLLGFLNIAFPMTFYAPVFLKSIGDLVWMGSLFWFISARLTLGDNYSPCFDLYEPKELITCGPYKYVRHPIYAANTLLLIGLCISSGQGMIIVDLVTLVYFYYKSALIEEAQLAMAFEGYCKYKASTPMLFPSPVALVKSAFGSFRKNKSGT